MVVPIRYKELGMDNCNNQLVTLTGYDLLDIKNALKSKIKSIDNPEQKTGWDKLLDKINRRYNNPKFKSDYLLKEKESNE